MLATYLAYPPAMPRGGPTAVVVVMATTAVYVAMYMVATAMAAAIREAVASVLVCVSAGV